MSFLPRDKLGISDWQSVTDYYSELKDHFGDSVNPDRCLPASGGFGADHRSCLLRDTLSSDSHDRRRKPEPTSRLSRNLIRRRKIYSLFLAFRSIGVVFSLTTEGHIDVGP